MDARVLVIGGGLSGLSTAWHLQRAGVDVRVLEQEDAAGGCIRTTRRHGYLLEHGPNSMLVNRRGVLDCLEALGLGDDMVEADKTAAKRFIVKSGALHALPSSPWSFVATPLFSMRDKLRLFAEPFIGRGPRDASVADFARRRLGRGFYEYAINPFVSGVYAGDPDQLMARAAVRKVWALEDKHGSLIRGAAAMMLGRDKPEGRIKGRLLGFRGGMGDLPAAFAAGLGDRVHTGVRVGRLERDGAGWTVHAENGRYRAAHLVLAVPAGATARLLAPFDADAVAALEAIPYAPVGVVHVGLKRADVAHALDGFGCLIPRKEGRRTLGMLFSSTLFPGRADDVLVTCFIGGATQPEVRDWSDDDLQRYVVADLTELLGLKAAPAFLNLVRWDRAIPQYTHGHFQRLEVVARAVGALPGLSTRANWHDGVSVPDCILHGAAHAAELAAALGPAAP